MAAVKKMDIKLSPSEGTLCGSLVALCNGRRVEVSHAYVMPRRTAEATFENGRLHSMCAIRLPGEHPAFDKHSVPDG